MTLLYFDGFDGYDTAVDAETYGRWHKLSDINISAGGAGRDGTGRSLVGDTGTTNVALLPITDQATNTMYCGFGFKVDSLNAANASIISFVSGTTITVNDVQCSVFLNGSSQLEIRRGTVTVLGTGSTVLLDDTWYFLEVKCLVHNSTGKLEVKLNETVEISEFTGDTQNESSDSISSILFGIQFSSGFYHYDDFYILNNLGSINNSYLGDIQCKLLYPSADNSVAWSPTGEASNYLTVDDVVGAPDDDTTYVSSSTTSQKDTYDLDNMATATSVHGMKTISRSTKTEVNPREIDIGITTGANIQATTVILGEGYGTTSLIFEDQDGAATAWTESAVNAAVLTLELTT